MGRGPRWMMPGQVYAYRTRKPGAVFGSPAFGLALGAVLAGGSAWVLEVPWWGSALLGVLAALYGSGRHFAYVGQTRNAKARHGEHMLGGGRYGRTPANWSDLDPKRYVLFRLPHCPQWVLDMAEVVLIRVLFPVYNVQHNRGNPRRIRPDVARRQRESRIARRWVLHVRSYHLVAVAALAIVAWRVVQS